MKTTNLETTLNKLNYTFTNDLLYKEAVTHSSYKNEHKQDVARDNERLEFVGDTLLNSFVALELSQLYPDMKEGELSKLRSSLVNESCLYEIAVHLEMQKTLKVGRGETELMLQGQKSILADAFEAVVAAIYYDSGFEATYAWFVKTVKNFDPKFFDLEKLKTFDAKTKLQELTLKEWKVLPNYTAKEVKKEKELWFEVELWVKDQMFGPVSNRSKKEAEKILAEIALDKLSK